MVQSVGERLVRVSGLDYMDWRFFVVQTPDVNAFIIPGNFSLFKNIR